MQVYQFLEEDVDLHDAVKSYDLKIFFTWLVSCFGEVHFIIDSEILFYLNGYFCDLKVHTFEIPKLSRIVIKHKVKIFVIFNVQV